MADKYFYNSNGDAVPTSQVDDALQEYKGTTMDGDAIYHAVYVDTKRQLHISYDTVVVNGTHHYIMGSGHERKVGSDAICRWDSGNRVTWQEALKRHTSGLIK